MGMTCEYVGCDRPATHAPEIYVPAMGHPQTDGALRFMFGLHLCRDHARGYLGDGLSTLDLANDALGGITLREFIRDTLRENGKHTPPDYARAWVVAVSLDSEEFATFEAAQARKQ